jgi:hypothetical protein
MPVASSAVTTFSVVPIVKSRGPGKIFGEDLFFIGAWITPPKAVEKESLG